MDKRHINTHQHLTKEPYPHSSCQSYDWDAESDTESLAQERAYQQLRLNISNNRARKSVMLRANSYSPNGHLDDDEADDLQVFDSLEMSHPQYVKKFPVLLPGRHLDSQRKETNTESQVFPDDAYSHLHYDPSPKVISKDAGRSDAGPLISIDESFLAAQEKPRRERKEVVRKDGYRLIANTSPPVVVMTPQNHDYDQPYLLHPQYGQNSTIATPPPRISAFELSPSVEDHTSNSKTDRTNENPNKSASAELIKQNASNHQSASQGRHVQQIDKISSPKTQKGSEDIVERNKFTLGRNRSKYGSYAKAHAFKPPQNTAKLQQTPKDTPNTEIQHEKQLQKTQQVKVSPTSKEKKGQRKESLIPSAPGVKAEQGDSLSLHLTKTAAKTHSKPLPSSSQPLAPTIHLNINLSASPHLPSFHTQKVPESIINLVSFYDSPHINPELKTALSPRQTKHRKPPITYQQALHTDFNHWNFENIPGQWQRLASVKEQLTYEEDQKEDFTVQTTPFIQQIPGSPSSSMSQSSGSYKVLPPIGEPVPEKDAEPSPAQRRVSDGYLMQMEKQKLLKTRPAYKAYSLKDYKQLKPDVTLQGLGPDYTSIEKTKMRRQKLYSNVIREHNKKISRIPSLPAKDPEASVKKVSRLKALEYAKTIAKPVVAVQSNVKDKRLVNQTEELSEHALCVDGLDLSQLTTLELLRKRHEEEKQAVALLRKIHVV